MTLFLDWCATLTLSSSLLLTIFTDGQVSVILCLSRYSLSLSLVFELWWGNLEFVSSLWNFDPSVYVFESILVPFLTLGPPHTLKKNSYNFQDFQHILCSFTSKTSILWYFSLVLCVYLTIVWFHYQTSKIKSL